MFEGAVGSCDVVGVWIGLHVGGGAILRALAHVTLGYLVLAPSVPAWWAIVVIEPSVMEY